MNNILSIKSITTAYLIKHINSLTHLKSNKKSKLIIYPPFILSIVEGILNTVMLDKLDDLYRLQIYFIDNLISKRIRVTVFYINNCRFYSIVRPVCANLSHANMYFFNKRRLLKKMQHYKD